ncbi:hypothetical protein LOTGIDRAFT_228107 [Lottia gigantea]|uniref:VWFA domain-containing protein n=1 Tax=Lottia gigantea TaxID=225164 RepID=V4BI34_LOTGI|nr:hypothetical protein LOTGIDRAFT_228107 [Lottia gigantea]ESP05582.1 hypothetical protein LOTGIDRAFT_228107 [Lottia gigantea]
MIALPNGPIEVVFSIDTTGSMSRILDEIQARLKDMITRLQADIPGIKFAVIAHGDYCDAEHFYVTKHVDFTDDLPKLCDFMNNVGGTGGGDVSECYELVLRMVRQNLSWTQTSQKVLIMIGDAYPHEPDYPLNTNKIDWKEEVQIYTQSDVHIYGVHVFDDLESEKFFRMISEQTFGEYIKMADFSHVCDVIMAICYRERGAEFLEGYEREVRSRFGLAALDVGLEGVFGALKRVDSKASNASLPTAIRTPPLSPLSSIDSMETDPQTVVPYVDPGSGSVPVSISLVDSTTFQSKTRKFPKSVKRVVTTARKPIPKPATVSAIVNPRLRRERVTVNNFRYSYLDWSVWKLAVQPKSGVATDSKKWINNYDFLVKKSLFRAGFSNTRYLYEFSVQTKPGGKRHVVYCDVINHKKLSSDWRDILNTDDLKDKVDNVMDSKCRIFVRRAVVSRAFRGNKKYSQLKSHVEELYDYVWSQTSTRDLNINGVDIA